MRWIRWNSLFSVTVLAWASLTASAQQTRPPITGISHMCVYSSNPAATNHFYSEVLKARKGGDPEDPAGVRYYFSATQFVEVLPLPPGQGISRLAHVAYSTTDAERLRAYLVAHGAGSASPLHKGGDGSLWFEVRDPEGNAVQFMQVSGSSAAAPETAISSHIIHVGMLVHSEPAEDHFYRDLLGFRPYWHGAVQPDRTDWVSQQVPDGHDWLEYMLVGDGSTTPLNHVNADQLGGMNHFSLGVKNMEQAMTTLIAADRMSPKHNGPQMGKDGKWQANLYDPDGTRVELMEFQPVMEPCCSAFTAESPKD